MHHKCCKCFKWSCFFNEVVSLISALIHWPSSWSQYLHHHNLLLPTCTTSINILKSWHLKPTLAIHLHLPPPFAYTITCHNFSHLCDRLGNMGKYEDSWYLVLGGSRIGNWWGLLASAGRGWELMLECGG